MARYEELNRRLEKHQATAGWSLKASLACLTLRASGTFPKQTR